MIKKSEISRMEKQAEVSSLVRWIKILLSFSCITHAPFVY